MAIIHNTINYETEQTFEKQLINFDELQFRRQVEDFEKNRDILNQIADFTKVLGISEDEVLV